MPPLDLPPDTTVVVVEAAVERGVGRLAGEPVTRARLRLPSGAERTIRVVGGPSPRGDGFVHLAGFVAPRLGERVRLDLRDVGPAARGPVLRPFSPGSPPATWPAARFPLSFSPDLDAQKVFRTSLLAEVDVAARTWSSVACTAFRAEATRPTAAPPGDDGVNGIYVHGTSWPAELVPGVVAQTVVHTDADGRLRDTDIHLNLVDSKYSVEIEPGRADLRGVLVHELGHALGLGHSAEPRATMFASGAGATWRSLEADDRAGVCALYPGAGAPGCGVTPCPSDFVCVAGLCQRRGEARSVCSPCQPAPAGCDVAGEGASCVAIERAASRGLVCARACDPGSPCGAGFTCAPGANGSTCVPTEGCEGLGKPCATDRDCPGAACLDGVCAGSEGSGDAGPSTRPAPPTDGAGPEGSVIGGGACTLGTGPRGAAGFTVAWALVAYAARRRAAVRRSR